MIADFIPYQGSYTFDELKCSKNYITDDERNFGAAIVIALCKTITNPSDTVIFLQLL